MAQITVSRVFYKNKNPIDFMYIDGIPIAEVTLIAKFGEGGKYTHNEYRVVRPAPLQQAEGFHDFQQCLDYCLEYNIKIMRRTLPENKA